MSEIIVLYQKDQNCPRCDQGKLQSASKEFAWICVGGCGRKIEKRCPCYYEKDLCRGCKYYRLCAHRPGISKKQPVYQPEGEV